MLLPNVSRFTSGGEELHDKTGGKTHLDPGIWMKDLSVTGGSRLSCERRTLFGACTNGSKTTGNESFKFI